MSDRAKSPWVTPSANPSYRVACLLLIALLPGCATVATLDAAMQARVATLEQQGKTVVVLGQPDAAPAALLALRDQIRPEAAAALRELKALGLGSMMLTGDNPLSTRVAEYYQDMLKRQLGLDVRIDSQIFKQRLAKMLAGDFDMVMAGWGPDYADPLTFGDLFLTGNVNNRGQYSNPAYDQIIQGMSGVMSITGEEGGPPVRVGASLGDIVAGMYLAQGVLAALYQRERTGEGAFIDVAMLDSQLAIQEHSLAMTTATGVPPGPTGARHPSITPFSTYRAADGFFVIAAGNDAMFAHLCKTLDLPLNPADPRFATNAERVAHRAELVPLLRQVTVQQNTAAWIEALEKANVPCGPINTLEQVFADPHVQARGLRVDVPHPVVGNTPGVASPLRFSKTPVQYRRAAPALGSDNETVLAGLQAGAPAII